MKSIFNIIILLFSPLLINAQISNIENIICEEHQALDRLFNDNIFIDLYYGESDSCPRFFETIKIDTLKGRFQKEGDFDYFYVIKVYVKLNKRNILNLPIGSREKIWQDTLEYILLNTHSKMYKLFGFYFTDINAFYYLYGKGGLNTVANLLVAKNCMSNAGKKMFIKAITDRRKEYPTLLSKPCAILKYYFEGNEKTRANTIILPLYPLIPFKI